MSHQTDYRIISYRKP